MESDIHCHFSSNFIIARVQVYPARAESLFGHSNTNICIIKDIFVVVYIITILIGIHLGCLLK